MNYVGVKEILLTTKKTDSSSTIVQQDWFTCSVNLPEAQDAKAKMWTPMWDHSPISVLLNSSELYCFSDECLQAKSSC